MKIIFMGTPAFARANLVALCESDHELLAVVTGQDSRSGRGRRMRQTACRVEAESMGIRVFAPDSLNNSDLARELGELGADLFVVAAFRILPRALYSLPLLGSINIHASLLPKYRGAAPINWAIIRGEKETGLTSFFLRDRVDTGDLILQEKIQIRESDSFDSLHQRFVELTGKFLLRSLEKIENTSEVRQPQDNNQASSAPKIYPTDALIDFDQPAQKVRDFIRGMSTKPGAFTNLKGKKLKIHVCEKIERLDATSGEPGSIMLDRKRLIVWCADAPLELTKVVPEGKKEMTGLAFLNGFRPQANEKFGVV